MTFISPYSDSKKEISKLKPTRLTSELCIEFPNGWAALNMSYKRYRKNQLLQGYTAKAQFFISCGMTISGNKRLDPNSLISDLEKRRSNIGCRTLNVTNKSVLFLKLKSIIASGIILSLSI